jgi:UTP:GlnB (protein PII) uridylyltransferase
VAVSDLSRRVNVRLFSKSRRSSLRFDPTRYPALARARAWSLGILSRRTECLAGLADAAVVAVSGSLGRLEAGPLSDVDLLAVHATAEVAAACDTPSAGTWIRTRQ